VLPVDVEKVSGLMREVERATRGLTAMYERLSRYVVLPLTRDDVVRRDDLRLEVEEAEARRSELVRTLLGALQV
jgi:hypothetical protein